MVSEVLKQAGTYELLVLDQQRITRMPTIPTAKNDDQPEMVEISSDEEEEEGQDDDLSAPPVRGSRKDQTSGETEAGEDDSEVDEEEDEGGQPSEAKKRRTEVRSIRELFDKMIREASQVTFLLSMWRRTQLRTKPTARR